MKNGSARPARWPAISGLEPCPICGKPATAQLRPFCSVRCADLDLGRWLDDSYAIPVEEDEEADKPSEGSREPPWTG